MTERERRKFLATPMVSKSIDEDGTVTPRHRLTSARQKRTKRLSVRERLQRNHSVIAATTEEIGDKFDKLEALLRRRKRREASSELIERATELALEQLKPEQPVQSEQRVKELIHQAIEAEKVRRKASRYRG